MNSSWSYISKEFNPWLEIRTVLFILTAIQFIGDLLILRHDDPHLSSMVMGLHKLEGKILFLRMVIAQESTGFVWVIPMPVYNALCGGEGGGG